ncbi:hypothetical protein FPOAC2_05157 [Fusarium poae]|uniref:Mid2 domain-containing protein n=1 Tax=Fusarium poae TaxID=36050 RepID=A0A1B8AU52_FUSPO|nr:hypothetical protein FPOAC1_005057 [Fusarium poae]KAG8671799.1 hypothetical protein FPOAC1_005057 [Fusarium poae]OBS24027.1 hypothetical protein FPOA_04575 [Fusarium poae]
MTRLIAALFLYFLPICFAANKCYYPNGIEANDFPCDPDAKNSVCCGGGLGTVCLSNKLCIGADGNTLRGSCTDKNWASPECAMYCLGADRGGTDLISCSNVTGSDTSFCCDHNPGCCNSGVGRFAVLPSNPKVWATWDRRATKYTVVGTVFIDEATSTPAPATSDASSLVTSASTYVTTTSEASASSSASNTPASADEPAGISTSAKAGIGAGVGVGAVLAMTVVYLLWRIRKNKATEREKQLPPTYYGPGTDASWQQHHYALGVKELQPQPPQELHGQALQGYNVRAELPAHN